MQLLGKRQSAAVNYTRMVTIIANNVVATTYNHGNHSCINRKSCGKTKGIIFTLKLGQLFLQLYMKIKRSVQKTAAGTTGTVFIKSVFSRFYHTLVTGKTRIGIRTEHQHIVSSHFNFGALLACDSTEIRIYVSLHKFLRLAVTLVSFL